VPAEYALKHVIVIVVVIDSMLAAYYEGKQIFLHRLSNHKNAMVVNSNHYRKLVKRQSFDVENTLMNNIKTVDYKPYNIDLSVYDEVGALNPYCDASANFENRFAEKLKTFAKYRVLIIDEMGYLPMDIQGANLNFSVNS